MKWPLWARCAVSRAARTANLLSLHHHHQAPCGGAGASAPGSWSPLHPAHLAALPGECLQKAANLHLYPITHSTGPALPVSQGTHGILSTIHFQSDRSHPPIDLETNASFREGRPSWGPQISSWFPAPAASVSLHVLWGERPSLSRAEHLGLSKASVTRRKHSTSGLASEETTPNVFAETTARKGGATSSPGTETNPVQWPGAPFPQGPAPVWTIRILTGPVAPVS